MTKTKLDVKVEDRRPLKWPDGQVRTLIDRRARRPAWKKTFLQYRDRLVQQLGRLGISEALITYNPSPSDEQDPGVAVYFSKPRARDFSWQVGLGIDSPMPTVEQIDRAFHAKALKHHPDKVAGGSGGDIKLYYQYDAYKRQALDWVQGRQKTEHEYVMACDRCTEPKWNLEAVRRMLMAVAVMDEFGNPGTLERTFKGFKTALPVHASTGTEG